MINILLLGGSKKNSFVDYFIDEASNRDLTVNFFAYELNDIEPIRKVAKILIGKKWNDPEVEFDLTEKIEKFKINIVIPFVDVATIICSSLAKKINNVFFVISPEQTNLFTYNKKLMNDWFIANNFKTPSTNVHLPIVAKPLTGSGAKGIFFLNSKVDLEYFKSTKSVDKYFLQEAVYGIEYSVDCYVDFISSEPIAIVPRKRLEVINGEATRTITEKNEFVIDIASKILKTKNFKGPVTIQLFMLNNSTDYRMIEINPRIGSGAYASMYAGANLCKFIINNFLGIINDEMITWKNGIIMTRTFKEFYFHADNY
jgi:carbamoyl-phosphate synthase large subunit